MIIDDVELTWHLINAGDDFLPPKCENSILILKGKCNWAAKKNMMLLILSRETGKMRDEE